MALKAKPLSATFPYPVDVRSIDENGEQHINRFKAIFYRKKRSEMDALWKDKPAAEVSGETGLTEGEKYRQALERDADWVMRFTAGWADGEVEVNGSTEFNRDNLLTLLDQYQTLALDMFGAFIEGNGGGVRKN